MRNDLRLLLCLVFLALGCSGARAQEPSTIMPASVTDQAPELTPRCSSDADCVREGAIGVCQAPGDKMARCLWQEVIPVPATVIVPKDCRTCQTNVVVSQLTSIFPGLAVKTVSEDDPVAVELIKRFKITLLPAYLVSREAEREPGFAQFSAMAELQGDMYYLKPQYSGVSYFSARTLRPKHLDLFLIVTRPGAVGAVHLLKALRQRGLSVDIRFVGAKNKETGQCLSPAGAREIDEGTLYACAEKYFPTKAADYLSCRLTGIESLFWDRCAVTSGMDEKKLKSCALSGEGRKLFEAKISLSEELNIQYGSLFLMENKEIFGVSDKTTAEEIIKIMTPQSSKK